MPDKEEQPEGIKVTDKRRFTEDGAARAGDDGPPPSSGEAKEAPRSAKPETKPLPQIDFVTFVLSLATSAEVHLGAIPNPASGKEERDIGAAKQTIDILGILQEKTKGNLSGDEDRLLQHLLYDLRMKYVEKSSETR